MVKNVNMSISQKLGIWSYKMIPSMYCALARVFCHVSHHKYKHFATNSKFQNNRSHGWKAVEALCFVLSHITWWNNFAVVKINESVEMNSKGLKDKVCQGELERVVLFWKSHCATCSPACVILCHVTGSCKEPICSSPHTGNGAPLRLNYSILGSG